MMADTGKKNERGSFAALLRLPDIRQRLLFTLFILVIIRFCAQIPIPGVSRDVFSAWFEDQSNTAMSLFDAMTGGSFSSMSIIALSITPYITASIIMQLLTVVFPSLEEMYRDRDGREKTREYTFYLAVALSTLQAVAMGISFYRSNYIADNSILGMIVVIVSLVAGALLLLYLSEEITKHGVGNGVSMILVFNIISSLPQDVRTLYDTFINGRNIVQAGLALVIILAIIIFMVAFIVCLQDAEIRISVHNSRKTVGRVTMNYVPIKVNTANVIPVIFASSLMSLPGMVVTFAGINVSGFWGRVIRVLSQSNWFNLSAPAYTVGAVIYGALVIAFAFFYTSISYNPVLMDKNYSEAGVEIQGHNHGDSAIRYLRKVINNTVLIGAVGLLIVALIPIICSGLFGANVSFGGTSLIIIVGVIIETVHSLDSSVEQRHVKGIFSK